MNYNPRISIYVRDKQIYELITSQDNKSGYVEKAIRFYEENKNLVERLANILIDKNID